MRISFLNQLTFCLCLFAIIASVSSAADQIVIRDGEKETTINGKFTFDTVVGIKIKPSVGNQPERLIPSNDIRRIDYDDRPQGTQDEWNTLSNLFRDSKFDDLLKYHEKKKDFLPKFAQAPNSKRHLDFQVAMAKASLVDLSDMSGKSLQDAISSLQEFLKLNPRSWQSGIVYRTLYRLLLLPQPETNQPNYSEAGMILESFGRELEKVSPEEKAEIDMLLVDLAYRQNNLSEAKAKLAAVSNNSHAKDKVAVYRIADEAFRPDAKTTEIIKKLDSIAHDPKTDSNIKALAYNLIGLIHQYKNNSREAIWAYLWVDVVYSQDRIEYTKAIMQLAVLFEQTGENAKAAIYREKLSKIR